MTMVFDDEQLRIDINEDLSGFGQSFSQTLNQGIVFTIKSPNGRMIQFKSRTMKWLEGPQLSNYVTDIDGYSRPDALDWDVDVTPRKSGPNKSPYYDDGGAHLRTSLFTKIGDQPAVSHTENLLFEEGKDFDDMKAHATKDKFRGISIIFIQGQVTHKVEWSRTGKGNNSYYKVNATRINQFPDNLKSILTIKGYNVTGL